MTDCLNALLLLVVLILAVWLGLRLMALLALGKQTRGDRAFNKHMSRSIAGKLKPGESEAFEQKWEWKDDHVVRRR